MNLYYWTDAINYQVSGFIMEQKWKKPYTSQKDKHEEQMKFHENLSFSLRLSLSSVRCEAPLHTAHTHAEQFPQEPWEGARKTTRIYCHPQKQGWCNSAIFSLSTKPYERALGISPSSWEKFTVPSLYVNNPEIKKQSLTICPLSECVSCTRKDVF